MRNSNDFDCVQLQRDIRNKHWKEAGKSFDGLMKYLDIKIENSLLLKQLLEWQNKAKQLTTAD